MSDLASTHEYASDVSNTKYMVHLPNKTTQETENFLKRVVAEWERESPQFYEFAIILDDKHIGGVSVSLDESRQTGALGWIVGKPYQGKGYATEAAKAVMDFAIKDLKVKKIIAHCDYRNVTSYRLMEKIGLSLECDDGVRRYNDSDEDIQELMYSRTVD